MANIQGGTSTANVVNVDSNFQLAVVTNTDPVKAGATRLFSENDAGTKTGIATCTSPETSADYRLRIGVDTLLDRETFNYTNQNTGKHFYNATTMTMALSGGGLLTNATGITTTTTGAVLRTWRYFPLPLQQSAVYIEATLSLSATAMATNSTLDFGLFLPNAAVPYAPTDGAFFRMTSAGVFGVVNHNTTELPSSALSITLVANQTYSFLIVLTNREAQFWIDDVLYATIAVPASQPSPNFAAALPYCIRHGIGSAAGSVVQARLWSYSVYQADFNTGKSAGEVAAVAGGSPQVQQGASTGGQLTTYTNGAAPGATTLTAGTGAGTSTLGGLYLLPAAVTAGEGDYNIFSWQNPAGTAVLPGKVFHCTSVIVGDMFVSVALTGGPMIFPWAVGYGGTQASLATNETTTFTANTTKIVRKIPLGIVQTVAATAPVASLSKGGQVNFNPPLPVNPGEFIQALFRAIGTNLTAGTIRGSVTFHGYFE